VIDWSKFILSGKTITEKEEEDMKKSSWCFVALVVALSLVLGTGGTAFSEEGHYGGTLTIAASRDVISLDGGQTNDTPSTRVIEQIFDRLVAVDEELNVIPHIAERWESNEDGTLWTYYIRRGVKFHDGSELKGKDVAFSYQRVLDDPQNLSRKQDYIGMIDEIKLLDEYTVQFHLAYPYAAFETAVMTPLIVPQAAVESMGLDEFGRHPIGSGPFKFKEWVVDDHITLVRNEDYWLKRPFLDEVVFRPIPEGATAVMSLLVGEVDILEEVPGEMLPLLWSDPEIDVMGGSGFNYYYLSFRCHELPYSDVRFRKMVYYAIDMDKIISTVLPNEAGSRSYSPTPPGFWPEDYEYMKAHAIKQDKLMAKALFDELVRDGVMTRDTEVVFQQNNEPTRGKIGEIVVSELQSIGVNAKLKLLEWGAYVDTILTGDEPFITMLGMTIRVLDPDGIFFFLFSSEEPDGGHHGTVIFRFPSHEMNELLREARTSLDRDAREALYTSIQRLVILEKVFHIPAYHLNEWHPVSKRVHGLGVPPFASWWIVTQSANVWVEE